MPLWAQLITVSAGVAGILGAAGGLWKLGRAIWAGARRVGRLLDDWFGEEPRPGLLEGRPGVMAQLDTLRTEVSELKARTADDRVARGQLERRVATLEEILSRIEKSERPRVEAGGVGFQAELSPEVLEAARISRSGETGRSR